MTGPTAPAPASLAQRAAALCLDIKANDVVVLDLTGVTDMTDFFVIASGTSDTHVRSVAEHVLEELRRKARALITSKGVQQGRWVLLDYRGHSSSTSFTRRSASSTSSSGCGATRKWSRSISSKEHSNETHEGGRDGDRARRPRLPARRGSGRSPYFGQNQVQYDRFDWR